MIPSIYALSLLSLSTSSCNGFNTDTTDSPTAILKSPYPLPSNSATTSSGFSAALRVELEEELDELCIEDEHMLSKKPMQIDVLVVKKKGEQPIRKNIGRIFRKHNIIEYKSPEDYLSINDFYKVYGYTCFYQSETKRVKEIPPEEITITFICNHYPQKLLEHLKKFKGIEVEKQV